MTLKTLGMGISKVMDKTAPGRKDQVLDIIKKSRKKILKLKDKKVNVKDVEGKKITIDDESKIMDVDTHSTVSSAPDKNIKKWLKHKGFKE